MDDSFIEKFKLKNNVQLNDYLHFGWIDSLKGIDYLGRDKKYSIPGLCNFLKMF